VSFLYIWAPGRPVDPADQARFEATLESERSTYQEAFGRPFHLQLAVCGPILVGQVGWDLGVRAFVPWHDNDVVGLAWSGICEDPPSLDGDLLESTVREVGSRPATVASWPGRFALCTWDRRRETAALITGATDSPSLWRVEGEHGWAVGSRTRPILDLVNRRPAIDERAAAILLAYGYLIGDRALLGPAQRVVSRTCIRFSTHEPPRATRYQTLADYLGQAGGRTRESLVTDAAAALRLTVRTQLALSEQPAVLLTGGRDSRSIAAALSQEGFGGPALTSGAASSPDVRVASTVAERLGLAHNHTSQTRGSEGRLPSLETALLWTRLTEGLQSLRQGMSHRNFMQRELPVPAAKRQLFHGMGGEIARGYYYPGGNLERHATGPNEISILVKKARPEVGVRAVEQLMQEELAAFDDDARSCRPSTAQWLDIFYWQQRCLQWGGDMLAMSDVIDWHWTPFMSRWWVGTAWELSTTDKRSGRFAEDLAVTLADQLRGVPYDTSAALRGMASRLAHGPLGGPARAMRARLAGRQPQPELQAFWRSIFLDRSPAIWQELPGAAQVANLVERTPQSEYLWDLAGIELVARAHLE
jgi:hypothetical protein